MPSESKSKSKTSPEIQNQSVFFIPPKKTIKFVEYVPSKTTKIRKTRTPLNKSKVNALDVPSKPMSDKAEEKFDATKLITSFHQFNQILQEIPHSNSVYVPFLEKQRALLLNAVLHQTENPSNASSSRPIQIEPKSSLMFYLPRPV